MAGVRIRHESLRHGTLAVEHPTKPYKVPYLCPKCSVVHKNKVIHIYIDPDGYAFISVEGLELLRQSGMPGLTYENEVANPPVQGINVDPRKTTPQSKAPVTPYQYDGTFKRLHVLKNRLFLTKGRPDG